MSDKSVLELEYENFRKKERKYLEKHYYKKDSKLTSMLIDKVPAKLQSTLDQVFLKSFKLIFDKGTAFIEKTYNKKKIENDYKTDDYRLSIDASKQSLDTISKKASASSNFNVFASSVTGVGLGVFGVGLPDIVLFTAFIFRSVYEIALQYGFDYESEEEKIFILLLIEGALSYEKDLAKINRDINTYIQYGRYKVKKDIDEQMKKTAACLSTELLYTKFLQGFMIIGAIGGAYDYIFLKRITDFSKLKYQRRYLVKKQNNID